MSDLMNRSAEPVTPVRASPSVRGPRVGAPSGGRSHAPAAALGGFLLVVLVMLALGPLTRPGEQPAADQVGAPGLANAEGASETPDVGPPQDDEVRVYAAGIEQVARVAGHIIEFEMKPALGTIIDGDPVAPGSPRAWAMELAALHDGLADQQPPAGLDAAHRGFLEALAGYERIATMIGEAAAAADPDDRDALLAEIRDLGPMVDAQWDDAYAAVRNALAQVDSGVA